MLKQSLYNLWVVLNQLLDQFLGAAWLGFGYAVGALAALGAVSMVFGG